MIPQRCPTQKIGGHDTVQTIEDAVCTFDLRADEALLATDLESEGNRVLAGFSCSAIKLEDVTCSGLRSWRHNECVRAGGLGPL